MDKKLEIGVIGDFDPQKPSHMATNDSLRHAAGFLGLEVYSAWLPTEDMAGPSGLELLAGQDGIWCGPGSPYRNFEGALRGIAFAREHDRPFLGT